MKRFIPLLAIACSAACASHAPAAMMETSPTFAPLAGGNANRAFAPYVKSNGFIFLAGQLGSDSSGKLVAGGIKEETRQTMKNIKQALEQQGSSMDKVVRCLVLLADINDRPAMSEVYVTFFAPDKRPARTAAGVSGLALNARVEIECWAAQ